jgi:hypothetical protein
MPSGDWSQALEKLAESQHQEELSPSLRPYSDLADKQPRVAGEPAKLANTVWISFSVRASR